MPLHVGLFHCQKFYTRNELASSEFLEYLARRFKSVWIKQVIPWEIISVRWVLAKLTVTHDIFVSLLNEWITNHSSQKSGSPWTLPCTLHTPPTISGYPSPFGCSLHPHGHGLYSSFPSEIPWNISLHYFLKLVTVFTHLTVLACPLCASHCLVLGMWKQIGFSFMI